MNLFADIYKLSRAGRALFLAWILGSAALAGLGHYEAAAAVALALLISSGRRACAAASPIELILIIWFIASPIASYYARLPADRSIVTFDRVVFCLLAAAALLGGRASDFRMTRFEKAWALVAAMALASAATRANNLAYALRIAFDSFALPLVAFHLARNYFDSNRMAKPLLAAAIATAFLLFIAGAAELATGIDLFPYEGSELIREGQIRPNGPFMADSSYAVICLLLFVMIRAAGDLLDIQAGDHGARIAYACGLAVAGAAALLAAFRAVAVALLLCLIIYEWVRAAVPRRAVKIWPAALVVGAVVAALLGIGAERAKQLSNLYGRLAAWEAAARMAADHPIFGVGLGNYFDYYDRWYSRQTYAIEQALSTKVAAGPHSNLLWIASELGLVGLIPYVAANYFLLFDGWRRLNRKRAPHAALFAAYWIPGLALASGFYSDLNLYFFFLMGVGHARRRDPLRGGVDR
jgi:O-antigen ligase